MELAEPVSVALIQCSEDCPFCKDKELRGYKTKKGSAKDETRLRRNLKHKGTVDSEKGVGPVFPLAGGGDPTTGWEAKADVLESFPVKMAAAPHHIIPGKAAMDPSRLEKWTVEGDKIKEDIGYNIDAAQNGIFLPHLPEIYFTRHAPDTKTPMAKFYGQTWKELSPSAKESIGFIIMTETNLQLHYTDHDDPYVHMDNETSYDDESKMLCNELADKMLDDYLESECKDGDGKVNPPYGLVLEINLASSEMKMKITGFPKEWSSWVSPLAQELTHVLRSSGGPRAQMRGLIRRI